MVAKGPGFQKRLHGYERRDIKKGGSSIKEEKQKKKKKCVIALNECDKKKT